MPLGRAAETLLVGIVPALADIWTFALPRVRLLFYVTLHLVSYIAKQYLERFL